MNEGPSNISPKKQRSRKKKVARTIAKYKKLSAQEEAAKKGCAMKLKQAETNDQKQKSMYPIADRPRNSQEWKRFQLLLSSWEAKKKLFNQALENRRRRSHEEANEQKQDGMKRDRNTSSPSISSHEDSWEDKFGDNNWEEYEDWKEENGITPQHSD